jgi:hypothetical protein
MGGPHQHREEILPCRGSDFDLIAEHVVFRPAHALRLVVLGWLDAQACPAIRDIGDRNEVHGIGVGGPEQLADLLATSGRGEPKEFRVSAEAFNDLMDGEVPGWCGSGPGCWPAPTGSGCFW